MSEENNIEGTGVYAPEVLELVRQINAYCTWLEKAEDQPGQKFISSAIAHLSSVYNKVILIPGFEPEMEGGNEKFVTEQDWSAIYQKVLHKLGSYNSYLRIAQENEFDRSDLVSHTISEDLADIYQDLKDFIFQYRQGIEEIMNDALWEVQDSFEQFWGAKLLNAMKALHNLYTAKIDPEAGEDGQEELRSEDSDAPTYDNSFFTRLQDLNEEEI